MKKKIFDTEYAANIFAEEVDGTVRMSVLPGYMSVETIWIVEMDEYAIKKIENEYITITRVAENPGKQTVDLDKMQKEEPELFNELLADYPKTTGKKKGLR